jgi:superfamily I DNA/RNA helicase
MPASAHHDDLLDRLVQGLTSEQSEVLRHDFDAQGPLLVLAGAGTGKTTVLTRRLAWECGRGVPAGSILALTFTRAAAGEMRERAASVLGPGREVPEVRTFHSTGLRILSGSDGRGWRLAGWSAPPRLLDDWQIAAEKAAFWMERFRGGVRAAPPPGDWTRRVAERGRPQDVDPSELPWRDDWQAWEERKRRLGIAEQHDLLAGALTALESDPALLAQWRGRASTLLVDEYQDTDRTQYRLVSLLAGDSSRLLAVGDDDQAIYGFRGADLRNVLDWKQDRPEGRILSLTANHRSLAPVLEAANLVFPDKPVEFRKILRACRSQPVPPRPLWHRARDQEEEIRWILELLGREIRAGRLRTDICLLVRANRDLERLRAAMPPWARGVEIATIHGAKGLEWPMVVVCGQDRSRQEGSALQPCASDEERRLFYVACTRARDRLVLTTADRRPQGDGQEERIPHPWMRLVARATERSPDFWGRLRRRILRAD